MRIDLHTHSDRSDGTDTPAALVRQAAEADLDVVALTDHDTFAGWSDARAEAERQRVDLVLGAEISCVLDGHSVHLLAYLPDPDAELLREELSRVRQNRDERVPRVVDRLRAHGVTLSVEDVVTRARGTASVGRPHIADALVAGGYATTRREALDQWLAEGRPGYVPKYAPTPDRAVVLVLAAGGAPVLAHPRGRSRHAVVDDATLERLARAGLAGVEVEHHDHDAATRQALRGVATELGLVVTGASDYHGDGKLGHALGSLTTTVREYERLLAVAHANAAAAGCRAPGIVSSAQGGT